MATMLRPHDILLLLKLAVTQSESPRQLDLALQLGLSQGEVTKSLDRVGRAGLYIDAGGSSGDIPGRRRRRIGHVLRTALLEFLLHGLRYVLPVHPAGTTRGVLTAWGTQPLSDQVIFNETPAPVWPHPNGTAWGPAVEPLCPTAPDAALRDPTLYEVLALTDALRLGRAHARNLAKTILTDRLSA